MILSVIGLLLNASALELTVGQDIDLNRELRAAGVANVLAGFAGGMGGYQALSASSLSYRIGSRGRLAGLLAGVICIVMLFTGQSWLSYFPKMILGGVLVLLGIDFLYEWVIVGYKRLSKADYGIVILILLVIASTNFLIGVVVGLVATVILFVLNYSKIEIVHHALSGTEMKSNVERSKQQREVLERSGKQTHILELQGYIFFGTANALLERMRAKIRQAEDPPVRFVILDFRRVSGLDASAVFSFVKCKQLAETQGIDMVLTNVSENIQKQLNQSSILCSDENIRLFVDLDRGLEWCEDQLLNSASVYAIEVPLTLPERLIDGGFHKDEVERLLGYLEREEFIQGDHLIQQGAEAEDLFFLEQGKISIYLELENDQRVRLQTLGTRTIVGEIGLYLGERRTASVVAEEPSVAYRLTKTALKKMQQNDPQLSAAFHLYIARLLAERVADTTRLLAAMSR
jgi:SulP family sulfate permease